MILVFFGLAALGLALGLPLGSGSQALALVALGIMGGLSQQRHLLKILLILESATLALVLTLMLGMGASSLGSTVMLGFLVLAVGEACLGLLVLIKATREEKPELSQI